MKPNSLSTAGALNWYSIATAGLAAVACLHICRHRGVLFRAVLDGGTSRFGIMELV